MGLDTPHGQFPHSQLYSLEGEQHIGELTVLEQGYVLGFEGAAVQQDTRLGKQLVDTVHPLLGVAAAALEDQALPALHAAQVLCGDPLYSLGLCTIAHRAYVPLFSNFL